ncbi:unnamed protein product [Acanthoscelides obtectus]|uniref:Myb-like domain-containing protein n=1 Tax=Acanthoscelides obtectus TaxID=200917 RepID=A0A9P0M558_ACAOB|nr:unnamed protein product [Acanthoscelides obtectus]CAK1643919.1 Transcription factor TFIIIB component B'' homolog [Acanthoscelides obtectus]
MATRRTRIKAVANVHQRRKNVEETIIKSEELEISAKKDISGKVDTEKKSVPAPEECKLDSNNKDPLDYSVPIDEIQETSNVTKQASKATKEEIVEAPKISADEFLHPSTVLDPFTQNNDVGFLKPTNFNTSRSAEVEKDIVQITNIAELRESTQEPSIKRASLPESFSNKDYGIKDNLQGIQQNENEYHRPPPSPTKINRSRIKAIPRLGYRKTSFSASESEDEGKRNRNRNDSVCSVASLAASEAVTECMSPHKPKETSYKKIVRTELTRKVAEARREFQRKFGFGKPDRQKLTMMDLIYYNPQDNPMIADEKSKSKPEAVPRNEEPAASESVPKEPSIPSSNKENSAAEEETEMPVPQIKIGPTGEIIIDEQSLVVEREDIKRQREEIQKQELIDGDFDTGYGIYKRHKRSKTWTHTETLRFYKALNSLGTDFTIMTDLFPNRSRRELKLKFVKEEKTNRALIDRALMQPCKFDYADLKREVEFEEKEQEEIRRQQEEENRRKKERNVERRKRTLTVQAENEANESAKLRKKVRSRIESRINNTLNNINNSPENDSIGTINVHRRVSIDETSETNRVLGTEETRAEHDRNETRGAYERSENESSQQQHNVENVDGVETEHCTSVDGDMDEERVLEDVDSNDETHRKITKKRRASTENNKPPKLRRHRTKKKTNAESILEDSDADESDIASLSESSDEELVLPSKPTRSGRMPKITKKYMAEREVLRKNVKRRDTENIEPGSIMVIAEDGPNNEPVYKIFMITPDNGRTPVNLSPDSVSRAIQLKKGIADLFSINATISIISILHSISQNILYKISLQ